MSAEVVSHLQQAQDVASLRAAILAATPFGRDATVQVGVENARWRLSRLVRMTKLTPRSFDGVPIERQKSHKDRVRLLMESRLKHALLSMGNEMLDVSSTEKQMKTLCHNDHCTDCSESGEYQAICLQFVLDCVRVRIQTRLYYDKQNGYNIPERTRDFMEMYVANPVRTWLDFPQRLYSLENELDHAYNTVVLATDDGTKDAFAEIRKYKGHIDSIAKMLRTLQACDRANTN